MDLFKLVGSIFIDNQSANDSLQKTDDKAKKVGTSFKDVAGKAAKVGSAIVGASAAAVSGIVAMADSTAKAADEIDKGSIRMGISTEQYQELAYAAGQCGVEMSTLEKAGKKLEGSGLDMSQAMEQIMGMETAEERAAKAAELFGESIAYQMSPMIEQSTEDYDGLIDRAHELGIIMSDDDVKAGVKLGDTMSDIQKVFKALFNSLGSAVMPLVQKFADYILSIMPQIQGMFDRMSPLIQMVFDKLMPPLMDLLDELLPILMDFLETLLPPIVEIVGELLPIIVELLQDILPILKPILDLIVALLKPILDIINLALKPLMNVLGGALKSAFEGIGKVINNVTGIFTKAWEGIKYAWQNAGTFFTNLWNGIKSTFKAGLNGIIWFLNKMIDGVNVILTPLRAIIYAVGELFGAHWSFNQVKIPNIPALKRGGEARSSGSALVGDDGPEIVDLPRGASVIPLNQGSISIGIEAMSDKMDAILTMLGKLLGGNEEIGVYIDGNALVGKLAPGMDKALGRLALKNGRHV